MGALRTSVILLGLSMLMQVHGQLPTSKEDTPPMVAFLCGKPAMHLTPKGWIRDEGTDCIDDAAAILDYCKKMYPEMEINNVVEARKKVTIDNWCKAKHTHCHHHGSHTVRPFRCLAGAFQSEALLVPDHCVFDHLHDDNACKTFQDWNETSMAKCEARDMQQQSFAILLPCGINLFGGVEFVCCPKPKDDVDAFLEKFKTNKAEQAVEPKYFEDKDESYSDEEEDYDSYEDEYQWSEYDDYSDEEYEDEYDEDEDDEDYDEEEDDEYFDEKEEPEEMATVMPTYPEPATDSYDEYLHNPQSNANEHDYFNKAKGELQKQHHEKVTKMMKEWAAARKRVQDMKATDPRAADKLNREITVRFQKTYQALEQEGMAEKKQLVALHQQRVQADLNEKKRHAMEQYMAALQKTEPDAADILKKLEHYMKKEQKDRMHSINHFKHLHDTDPAEAERIRRQTLDHLAIIDQRIQQSLEMLNRVPEFAKKIQAQAEAYLATFHELDESISELLVHEEVPSTPEDILAHKEVEHQPSTQTNEPETKPSVEAESPTNPPASSSSVDELHRVPLQKEPTILKPTNFDDEVMEDEHAYIEIKPDHIAHQSKNMLSIKESSYVKKEPIEAMHTGSTMGIAIGCIAVFVIVVIGIIVLRKKAQRVPVNHGFVEVDQAASPEERHVANMQINGYENPTYKYFEMNTA